MKTILVTAYAVNPYKGSEDAMGWNMILQVLRHHQAIVVTRKNNQPAIEQYLKAHASIPSPFQRLTLFYFDWPKWSLHWKKGPILSMLYFYGWQLTLAIWLKRKNLQVDIVHNLNFHNDWTPSFLWLLGKPLVWGHVGHHPKIPSAYILPIYGWAAYLKDRMLWALKNMFWYLDPFLYLCKRKAAMIICMNNEAVKHLRLKEKFIIHPSVAAEKPANNIALPKQDTFKVIAVGRFVALKGFDLGIKAFAVFYKSLSALERSKVQFCLIGSGPEQARLQKFVALEGIEHAVTFIDWLPRAELQAIYSAANVFLFPSHEGAGMVVPEAMSYGLPVICLNNCGPGELTPPTSTLKVAYGVYSTTVKALAGKLQDLMFNPILMETEKQLAYQRFAQLFEWEVRGDMLKEIYARVLTPKIKENA